MNIDISRENDLYIISPVGELDASSCILLDQKISEAVEKGEKKLLIDCSELSYISSAGLGVFMSYLQDFEENKIKMVLYNMGPKVKSVFRILGLDELIVIVSGKEEAVKLVNESKL